MNIISNQHLGRKLCSGKSVLLPQNESLGLLFRHSNPQATGETQMADIGSFPIAG